ncbi:DMT family transporter [Haloarcula onubensis]|uniref:DMT family transporter n=1 Tax=Haloarcula onubensis TaxID=2950539 RepID=A0ABU2FR92_9EURY|nr:DMT family transporter [Halomicroarcula sp. S3CR25-11]MDS0283278.1 DMT family transporter [Halomicroarcula sp. S3CR25-11]
MSKRRAVALFVLLALVWGTAFVAIKAGLRTLPPVLFAAVRYDVAALVMLCYAAASSDYWLPRTRADRLTLLVEGTLIIALYNAFLFVGQQDLTSGVGAILVGVSPLLSTGFARVFLPSERLTAVGVVGLVVGFLGVALVARPSPAALLGGAAIPSGLVVLAAAAVALGSVLVQRLDGDISSEGMVAWSTALGAALLHAISLGLPGESLSAVEVTVTGLLAVVYLAVFASALGYVIYFDLLARVGAIEINLVTYAVPVVASISGWLVLDERLGGLDIAGFCCIFAGFILLKRRAVRAELGPLLARFGFR